MKKNLFSHIQTNKTIPTVAMVHGAVTNTKQEFPLRRRKLLRRNVIEWRTFIQAYVEIFEWVHGLNCSSKTHTIQSTAAINIRQIHRTLTQAKIINGVWISWCPPTSIYKFQIYRYNTYEELKAERHQLQIWDKKVRIVFWMVVEKNALFLWKNSIIM